MAEEPGSGAPPAGGRGPEPLGAVLAGGAARRMGGAKMGVLLDGRPLVAHAIAALRGAVDDVIVVAKRDTPLPELDAPVWTEPDEPRHPLAGVAWALERAGGRPVLALAGDMTSVPAALLRALVAARGDAPSVVPRHAGGPEPLVALYRPAAVELLRRAAADGMAAREAVRRLGPTWLDWPDASAFRNVNAPADLAR